MSLRLASLILPRNPHRRPRPCRNWSCPHCLGESLLGRPTMCCSPLSPLDTSASLLLVPSFLLSALKFHVTNFRCLLQFAPRKHLSDRLPRSSTQEGPAHGQHQQNTTAVWSCCVPGWPCMSFPGLWHSHGHTLSDGALFVLPAASTHLHCSQGAFPCAVSIHS